MLAYPSKEGAYCKCDCKSSVGIVSNGGICLANCTESIDGVEHAGQQEAYHPQYDDLRHWVCVDSLPARCLPILHPILLVHSECTQSMELADIAASF